MRTEFYNYLKVNTMAKKFLLVTGILLLSVSLTITAQQQYNYSGTVYSSAGEILPGVNVIEKGTANGTVTDSQGKFLYKSSSQSLVLTFSIVGFTIYEKEMKQGENVDIKLEENIIGLDEVVVVGYGTQKRANITGAISNMNAE